MLGVLSTEPQVPMVKRKVAEVVPFIDAFIARKEEQIAEMEQIVARYEKKRQMEERSYQSMSTLRRMFSGKKPDHHLAVEYIHYVKKPMDEIKQLRQEIELARSIMKKNSKATSEEEVLVSEAFDRQLQSGNNE